jgi:uncharacterized protein YndB with AHSA1/START domain
MTSPTANASPELVITRTFRAPRELVWKAWADPAGVVALIASWNFWLQVSDINST